MRGPSTIAELKLQIDELGIPLPLSDNISVLSEELPVGNKLSPNRFVALPMEGADCDADGSPAELTFRRYERMAAGGAGIIWMEACAVIHEGRSKASAFFMQESNLDKYRDLIDRTRKSADQDIVIILQLTHSGRYAKPDGKSKPVMVRHCPVLDKAEHLPPDYPLATDEFLNKLSESYVKAAKLAEQAGFDGVDIKACHGYLVSSLLGAHEREGKFGGSYENRIRFLKETLALIQEQCPSLLVTTRLNIFDGMEYPYGFGVSKNDPNIPDMAEPLRLVKELSEMGVPLISVSLGFPRFDPHFGRPSADAKQEHPLVGINRFCNLTKQAQKAAGDVPVVNAALGWLEGSIPNVAAGLIENGEAQLIGQGRNSLAYPDAPNDILSGDFNPNQCCVTCSGCSKLLKTGKSVGCIVRDRETYKL